MKNIASRRSLWILGLIISLSILGLTSCNDDDKNETKQVVISKVYLQDVNSSVPDREVSFVRLGQTIRIEGSGFTGLRKVYINGFDTYFNPVFVSDNSMLITVSKNTPTQKATADVRNTIRMVKNANEATLAFEVRSSAPSVSSVSNTLPKVGEPITIYGTGLVEISKIVFPGNVEVTTGITSSADGSRCTVSMPDGVSPEGGAILVLGANGGAYSPAYFNFKKGVILDFDGNGTQGSWGSSTSMIKPEDLESAVVGTGNTSQGKYCNHMPSRFTSFGAAKNRCSEVWTAGNGVDDWRGQITPYIPATASTDSVAFQFDIYVPSTWTATGYLKICLVNGFNGGEWDGLCYNVVPWINSTSIVPFKAEGWTTVTVPFSKFYKFAGSAHTFEDVLAAREAANYKNFGLYFENSDFKMNGIDYTSAETTTRVYTDNWRIVKLSQPKYSDF